MTHVRPASSLRLNAQAAARSWFVDSLAPVEITGNYELDPPRFG